LNRISCFSWESLDHDPSVYYVAGMTGT
jgi:hypothetical protein